MIIMNLPSGFHEEFHFILMSTLELRQHYLEHIRKTVSKDIGLLLIRFGIQAILIELSEVQTMISPLKVNSIITSIINATVQISNKKKLSIYPLLYLANILTLNATNSTSKTYLSFDSKYAVFGLINS